MPSVLPWCPVTVVRLDLNSDSVDSGIADNSPLSRLYNACGMDTNLSYYNYITIIKATNVERTMQLSGDLVEGL